MKKLMFLIASILVIGTACVSAGCSAQGGPDANDERSYNIEQQNSEVEIPEENDDNCNDDCKDGNCEDKLPESIPEFNFKPHRPYNMQGRRNHERETVDDVDGDGNEDENEAPERVEHVRPHKTRPNRNNPTPRPMPLKPRK
ncbi:MAG: hypothetical protein K2J83_06580 [Clostridia bacterium]|nr:hypothetical protein [Clostridia bacterium]